jgi:hypothetical protein
MADNNTPAAVPPNTVTLPKPPVPGGNGKGHPAGVVETVGESSLSRDLLKPPKTFEEALAWGHISTRNVENVKKYFEILNLWQWCTEFDDEEGIEELRILLTGFPSVGGYNRSQAIQSDVKIVSPEALGVDLDKNSVESLRKAQKEKEEREKERDRRNH